MSFLYFIESKTQIFYPDSNYIEEDKYSPGFLTSGQKFSIALGSTVVLPCKINETGCFIDSSLKKKIKILNAL